MRTNLELLKAKILKIDKCLNHVYILYTSGKYLKNFWKSILNKFKNSEFEKLEIIRNRKTNVSSSKLEFQNLRSNGHL